MNTTAEIKKPTYAETQAQMGPLGENFLFLLLLPPTSRETFL